MAISGQWPVTVRPPVVSCTSELLVSAAVTMSEQLTVGSIHTTFREPRKSLQSHQFASDSLLLLPPGFNFQPQIICDVMFVTEVGLSLIHI